VTSLPFFQVDAFADRPLTGNPAAVMPLERWLDDNLMQAIATENNLSETAFVVPSGDGEGGFARRRHVLIHSDPVRFKTLKAGVLTVTRRDDLLELDMRAANLSEAREPELCRALGLAESPVWLADGYNDAAIVEVADEAAVRAVKPEFAALKSIRRMAVVTARGKEQDVASRVFVPYLGIDEDPVTGSAHAALAPYWTKRLGRNEFTALQASSRTGMLHCRLEDGRAIIGGRCQTVIVGQFQL